MVSNAFGAYVITIPGRRPIGKAGEQEPMAHLDSIKTKKPNWKKERRVYAAGVREFWPPAA
jgi:hypothetical protein